MSGDVIPLPRRAVPANDATGADAVGDPADALDALHAASDFVDQLVAGMPDFVKLVITGIAVEPPVINRKGWGSGFIEQLDVLVAAGIAIASVEGPLWRYSLTELGQAFYEVIKDLSPAGDGTLGPANDIDDAPTGPSAA